MKKQYITLAALFLVALFYVIWQKATETVPIALIAAPLIEVSFVAPDGRQVVVNSEIAANHEQRITGLMNRHQLPENQGMLFIWPSKEVRAFWMKNTYIPLDMVFLNGTKILGVVENALPHTLSARTVGLAGNAVLEVNAGFMKKHAIGKNWKVMYSFTDIIVK